MEHSSQLRVFDSVTCPFCGLLCDDLTIERSSNHQLKVSRNGCVKSVQFFERPPQPPQPRIAGASVGLPEAIAKAAALLGSAQLPLFAGLGAEVQGMRAVMSLADKTGAVLDHMHSNSFMRNLHVVQNSGWQIATLTEVRNRVDLLVIVGTDIVSAFPRFFEREVWNPESMFGQDTSRRQVVYLGGRNLNTAPGAAPDGTPAQYLPCDLEQLPQVIAALRALLLGKRMDAAAVAGIDIAALADLAARLQAAQYSVIAWSAAALDFPHAELALQNLAELIKELNKTTRANGLPLGGNEGDASANQVSAWISGYPMRTCFARGYPEHDPTLFSADRLLASGEADALLWVSSFNPERTPPTTGLPTVVLGHPDMQLAQEPSVFIPVGLPGADHAGVMFRSDGVVSLPLEQLRESSLPTLSEVLSAIESLVSEVGQ